MALETLANVTQDEVEYARMSNLIKSQLDYQSGMVESRREGLREGFAKGHDEGRNEASLEIAQKMKTMGDSIEKIHTITGIPIETIEQMSNNN
jgi:predicted transposase/invertase (TIGR01784 family)